MTQLVKGNDAPQISLPAIDGSTFNMADMKGKRVILTFYRFSSCPLCNMRIRRIVKRWSEFSNDAVMVAVFDAKIGELKKRMKKHNAPFIVAADETYEEFTKNGVKKSGVKHEISYAKMSFRSDGVYIIYNIEYIIYNI